MKTLCKTALLGLAFVSTASMAQLSNFTGWEAGASLNANKAKTKGSSASVSVEDSNNNASLSLHGGYGLSLNNDYALLFGLDVTTNKIKSGEFGRASIYFKTPYSVSVAPAMLLNDNTLLYVKLSHEAADLTSSTNDNKLSIKGYGLGAGGRYLLSKGMYVQAELKGINYKDTDQSNFTYKNSNTQVNIGIGFNF